MKNILFAALLITLFVSCDEEETNLPVVEQNDPDVADTLNTSLGVFVSYAHGLSGKAILVDESDQTNTLRFEEFSMAPGPDVHVLLSKSNNYSAANVIDITTLMTGYTNSNVNFTLDHITFSADYKFVLVYCIQYNSLFGYAELK